jgi:hypothetical protein
MSQISLQEKTIDERVVNLEAEIFKKSYPAILSEHFLELSIKAMKKSILALKNVIELEIEFDHDDLCASFESISELLQNLDARIPRSRLAIVRD